MKGIVKNAAIVIALGMAGGSMAAHAGDADIAKVRYSAHQLETEYGRDAVYRQLRNAAEAVCGSTYLREAGSLYMRAKNAECQKAKMDEMIDKIGNRDLTDMHRDTGVVVGD